jgi:hypothetical protein
LNSCHQHAKCENTFGSFNCSCLDGFKGNGTYCEDIDECKMFKDPNKSLCNNTGVCINTIGYYNCECLSGFERMNNSVLCTGIYDTI